MGILIGLITGLTVAAGIAWYLTSKPSPFKTTDQAPRIPAAVPVPDAPTGIAPNSPAAAPSPPQTDKATAAAPPAPAPPPAPKAQALPAPSKPARESPPPAKSDFTFFDILPGEPGGKAPKQKLAREVWWLQVAALREAKDADRLKARLALLGLPVQTQKVASGETVLHRVRVGPFKTEDEALGALDIRPRTTTSHACSKSRWTHPEENPCTR
jgi:cell division protein FtsN